MTGRDTAIRRAQILRGAMLTFGVPEVSIEVSDGRPGPGDTWNACNPVALTSHHIASKPTVASPTPGLALVKRGRSDLPGPLANGTAGVDLVYRIICMGMANHPGLGGPLIVSGPMGRFTIPRDLGRPYLWGTEYEGGYSDAVWDKVYTNRRTGKSMSFREFMGRSNAGLAFGIWLINGHGRTPVSGMDLSGYQGEHKTWAPGRKPDRLNYSTESGRAELRRFQVQEDDVSAADVWKHLIKPWGDDKAKPIPAGDMLAQSHRTSKAARENAAAALRQGKQNRAAIKALAAGMPGDVAAAVTKALEEDVKGDDKP